MKEEWFIQWLEKANYTFWYEERGNEVWKNDKFVVVCHEVVGLRLMIPIDYFSVGYLCKIFIPNELARQEL